jgi:hypothetical protein
MRRRVQLLVGSRNSRSVRLPLRDTLAVRTARDGLMRLRAAAATFLLVTGAGGRAQTKTVAERLGYPPDAKFRETL